MCDFPQTHSHLLVDHFIVRFFKIHLWWTAGNSFHKFCLCVVPVIDPIDGLNIAGYEQYSCLFFYDCLWGASNGRIAVVFAGRYLFLNAMVNQLRYPNSHTHYFSCTLLYLFVEANSEVIQEQITRVLLERLIVNRPHPWGLLITFIELIRNPQYKFWNHEFVHCAPEIEK